MATFLFEACNCLMGNLQCVELSRSDEASNLIASDAELTEDQRPERKSMPSCAHFL